MSYDFHETFSLGLPDVGQDLSQFSESTFSESHGLVTEIAAIHEGVTANFTEYSAAELANSLSSWYTPYQKPIILNHDKETEPLGRIIGAKMAQEDDGTPFSLLQAAVVDPVGMQKVKDRRYLTGSVGGKANEAVCTVCDTDWAHPKEGLRGAPCPHQRGRVYKGKLATLAMRTITWVEYSFVNVPADSKSGVRGFSTGESEGWNNPVRFFALDLNTESIVEYKEGIEGGYDLLGEMKKKDASPMYHDIKGAFIQAQISAGNIESEESANTYIDDTNMNSDSIEPSSEENDSMPNEENVDTPEEQEEDILSITDEVAEGLNAPVEDTSTDDTSDDSADMTEQDNADGAGEDTNESDDKPTNEDADQAQSSVTTDEATNSDDAPDTDTNADEAADVVAPGDEANEQTDNADLTVDTDESEVSESESRVAALEEENKKLKNALHRTLAERVVDAKIAHGLVEADTRKDAVTEHAGRTASSLRDSLLDLAALPVVATAPTERVMPTGTVKDKSGAVLDAAEKDIVDTDLGTEDDDTPSKSALEQLEDRLVSGLLGKRPL